MKGRGAMGHSGTTTVRFLEVTTAESKASLLAFFDTCCQPHEVAYVRDKLVQGAIDGRTYDECIIGQIAKVRGMAEQRRVTIAEVRGERVGQCMQLLPFEEWLLQNVRREMQPESSPAVATLVDWCNEWLEGRTIVWPQLPEHDIAQQFAQFTVDIATASAGSAQSGYRVAHYTGGTRELADDAGAELGNLTTDVDPNWRYPPLPGLPSALHRRTTRELAEDAAAEWLTAERVLWRMT
jgi:hypothetical protein